MSLPTEFDRTGVTYYAIAPDGYVYSSEQTAQYSTRKYTTLAACAAAMPYSPSTPFVVNIIGSWTTALATSTWSGPTFTATNWLIIRCIGDARHNGTYSTTAARISVTSGYGLKIYTAYTTIEGLQFVAGMPTAAIYMVGLYSGVGKVLDSCLLKGAGGTPSSYMWGIEAGANSLTIKNCVIYDWSSSITGGVGIASSSGYTVTYENNTIRGCDYGLRSHATNGVATNNVVQDCSSGCYYGTSSFTGSNNVSDDSTAPGTSAINGEVAFEDEANGNFQLTSGDTIAKGAGVTLPDVDDDITGTTRNSPPSCGAFEGTSGGGGGTVQLTGSVSGTTTVSGTIRGKAQLVGTCSSGSANAGVLRGRAQLQGSLTGTCSVTGTLSLRSSVSIAGTASGSTTTTGTLRGAARLSGSSVCSNATSASLQAKASLSGATSGTVACSASLRGVTRLAGTSSNSTAVSGSLRASTGLVGAANGSTVCSGTIRAASRLSGTTTGNTTTGATLRASSRLFGSVTCSSAATGALSSSVSSAGQLAGSTFGSTANTATLRAKTRLNGQASGTLTLTASVSAKSRLSGSSTCSTVNVGNLSLIIGERCSGSAFGSSTLSGSLSGKARLNGEAHGSCAATGVLSASLRLAGGTVGSTSLTGRLSVAGEKTITGGSVTVVRKNIGSLVFEMPICGSMTIKRVPFGRMEIARAL